MKNRILTALLTATTLAAGAALAADAPTTPEGYVRTGKSESCLRLNRIDSLKILNQTQILVKTTSGEAWLQEPRSCSKLRKSYTFVYEAPTGDLCDTTIIHLTDSGMPAGSCVFDKFEKLEKKTAAAD